MICNFESLCFFLNNELNNRRKNEVITHLYECDICLEAVVTMLGDRGLDKTGALRILGQEGLNLPANRVESRAFETL